MFQDCVRKFQTVDLLTAALPTKKFEAVITKAVLNFYKDLLPVFKGIMYRCYKIRPFCMNFWMTLESVQAFAKASSHVFAEASAAHREDVAERAAGIKPDPRGKGKPLFLPSA